MSVYAARGSSKPLIKHHEPRDKSRISSLFIYVTQICVTEIYDMEIPRPTSLFAVVRDRLRLRHYSPRTEKSYIWWMRRYIRFCGGRHPRGLGATEITTFLTHLAVDMKVSASTQNQALQALLFLYRHVLEIELPLINEAVRVTRPRRLPVVLTRDEVRLVLQQLQGSSRLVVGLLYGGGPAAQRSTRAAGERPGSRPT